MSWSHHPREEGEVGKRAAVPFTRFNKSKARSNDKHQIFMNS